MQVYDIYNSVLASGEVKRDIKTAGLSNPREYRVTKTIDIFNSTQFDLTTNISKSCSKKQSERANELVSRKQLIKKIQNRTKHEKMKANQKNMEYSNDSKLHKLSNSYLNNMEIFEDSGSNVGFKHSKTYEKFYNQAIKLFNRRFTKFQNFNHLKIRKEMNKSQEYINLKNRVDEI